MQVPSSAIVSPAQVLLLLVLYERFVHNAPNVHVFIEPGMMAVVGCAVCTDSHVELSSLIMRICVPDPCTREPIVKNAR